MSFEFSFNPFKKGVIMRNRKTFIFLFSFLFVCVSLKAQVQVKLHKAPPNKLKIVDLWYIDLDNTTQNTYTVYLHVEVTEGKKGLIFRGNSNSLQLPPGKKRIKKQDIKEVKDIYYNKQYERYIKQYSEFPDGDYTVCISVINKKDGQELDKDCIQQKVSRIGKIRLLSPKEGAVIKNNNPLFTWLPPIPSPPNIKINYTFSMVEILKGQTKEEAIKSNPAWYEKKDITGTTLKYPISARKLEKGKKYAWQVTMSVGGTEGGKSNIRYVIFSSSDEDGEDWVLDPVTPDHGNPVENPNPSFVWRALQLKNGKRPKVKYSLHIIYQRGDDILNRKAPRSYYESWTIDSLNKYTFFTKSSIKDTVFEYPKDAPPLKSGDVYMWWAEAKYKNRTFHSDTIAYFPYRWTFCEYDFGDAPDDRTAGSASPYPTFRNHNGARHKWFCCGDGYLRMPVSPSMMTKCLCCEQWNVATESQAWLGEFPDGYDPADPGTHTPDCGLPYKIDWEVDARISADNFDDGIYFFSPCEYCDTDTIAIDSIDVFVNTHPDYDRNDSLFFDAWFDWNNDGNWGGLREHIFWLSFPRPKKLWPSSPSGDPTILPSGYTVVFHPSNWGNYNCAIYRLYFHPRTLSLVRHIWTRFRLTPAYAMTIIHGTHRRYVNSTFFDTDTGEVISGEVEDYEIECESIPPQPDSFDFGDAPDELDLSTYHYCSHLLSGGGGWLPRVSPPPWTTYDAALHQNFSYEWLGSLIDYPCEENCPCGPVSATAEENALTINRDLRDDGIKFFPPYDSCDIETVLVKINTNQTVGRYNSTHKLHLHAWFDFNKDGDWEDSFPCSNTWVSEHLKWLNAKMVCPSPSGWFPVNNQDFAVDPSSEWLNDSCGCYLLTFNSAEGEYDSAVTDTMWTRFRLSYDNTGTGTSIASNYYGRVRFGEVEDYPVYSQPDTNQCDCEILKIHVNTKNVEEADTLELSGFTPFSATISVDGSCGTGCDIVSDNWTITKPGGLTESRTGSSFVYSFSSGGIYTFCIIITCSDGSICERTFYVSITSEGGKIELPLPPPER